MIYAIGDIHGCHRQLIPALDEIASRDLRPEETVVFLGDYIDRGNDSRAVVDSLMRWKEKHGNTVFLRGNHEQMLLDAREDLLRLGGEGMLYSDALPRWWQNGGNATARSYRASMNTWPRAIPPDHWQFFRQTAMEYAEGGYHFLHAGRLPEGMTWEYADRADIDPRLWIRGPFLSYEGDFQGKVVVFGHTPQLDAKPLIHPNKIGLDTAAVFGGKLSMAVLDPDADGEARLEFELLQWA
ncbi:MAG: serine/threonine protein phosphatase [Armatimonadetes bacterium]|nr:serine/threonine protein phosphatase [Armatimonadota bacterium]